MLLVATAFAQELPWECPPITAPEDGLAYVATDGGLLDAYRALEAAAEAYTADCAWVTTSTDTWDGVRTESTCETALATATLTELSSAYSDTDGDHRTDERSLVVNVPSGAEWTRIRVTEGDWSSRYGGRSGWTGEWDGAFGEWPRDGSFEFSDGGSSDVGWTDYAEGETPGCTWYWREANDYYSGVTTIVTSAQSLTVEDFYLSAPGCWPTMATLDGVFLGAVDPATWEIDPADLDADGYTGAACDCDETDASAHAWAPEIEGDGVDQDCDGADDVDLDDDGYQDVSVGGLDCDDGSDEAHPGADDPVGDGVDQDCDGADDVDADGDGFTADGDDEDADCDDAAADVYPSADEVPYDGIDQDCDGGDLEDADGDGEEAVIVGGTDCDDADAGVGVRYPEIECDGIDQDCDGADACDTASASEEEHRRRRTGGCGGCADGSGALLLLPVGLLLRRRPGVLRASPE